MESAVSRRRVSLDEMISPMGRCKRAVSRPGEFRPQPLAEPYVTVSRHTAPIALPVALP